MTTLRRCFSVAAQWLVALTLLTATAQAQVARTFVSTAGSDANTASLCSLTSPCRSFAAALTVTNAGGEIIALTSGGYGPVTIDKSVSVIAPGGVYAGITTSSGDGITINAPGGTVVLRGLHINSAAAFVGAGIKVNSAAAVHVEECVATGFTAGGAGIRQISSGALFVKDTILRNNLHGVHVIAPEETMATVSIDNTRAENNTGIGFFLAARTAGSISRSVSSGNQHGVNIGGVSFVTISDTSVISNTTFGILAQSSSHVTVRASTASGNEYGFYAWFASELSIEGCTSSNNTNYGVGAEHAGTIVRVSSSVVTNNSGGFAAASGSVIKSRGNNTADGNGPTVGTLTPLPGT